MVYPSAVPFTIQINKKAPNFKLPSTNGNLFELNKIPIIALSAHAMEEHKKRALDAGCNDYDTKPVDIERLLNKINKQLGL